MKVIRVLLADDHRLFRYGLRLLLDAQEDMEVVGEAGNGEECMRLVAEQQPDVLLMDVTMPVLDGIETTRRITGRWPQIQVVGLTMHGNERYFRALLEAGAVGYVLKGADPDDLVAAVRMAAHRETYLDPVLARVLVADYRRLHRERDETGDALSEREEQVLRLIAEGKTGREIAEELVISPHTVERHRSNLLTKLQVRNKAELIQYAIRTGLLRPGEGASDEQ
jgi:DNA-binding NarL/FixJ family response regulator